MKTLPYDVSRCSGVIRHNAIILYDMQVHRVCQQRHTCQRYLAFTQWDRDAGIPDYKGIPVRMAVEDCEIKIEV